MPKNTESRPLRRRTARVEYPDGRVEEYNLGKPIYEYQANQLGIDPATDPTDAAFFTLWIAAGKPGANGAELTLSVARPLLEAWLETVENAEFADGDEDAPPTKRRGTSRTSPA